MDRIDPFFCVQMGPTGYILIPNLACLPYPIMKISPKNYSVYDRRRTQSECNSPLVLRTKWAKKCLYFQHGGPHQMQMVNQTKIILWTNMQLMTPTFSISDPRWPNGSHFSYQNCINWPTSQNLCRLAIWSGRPKLYSGRICIL